MPFIYEYVILTTIAGLLKLTNFTISYSYYYSFVYVNNEFNNRFEKIN